MKDLETERLILRHWQISDAIEAFNNWASDKRMHEYVNWPVHTSVEQTKDLLSKWIASYENGAYNWAVCLKSTNEIIGDISVESINKRHKTCEVGCCYAYKSWGKGYGTEALKCVLNYLLNEEDFYLVEAAHATDNPASGRSMEKAGMKKDGVLRGRIFDKNLNVHKDLVYYSIIKDEL